MANSLLVISPMAGVTDSPFRHIALKYGADYGISEMLTSQTNLWGSDKTQYRLKNFNDEPSKILQIAGASPEVIQNAAIICEQLGASAIEINMGCPAKKVCKVLAGSALLRDELLVSSILAAAVNAVSIPVYLKTRLGWDHEHKNIQTIAKVAQDCGIKSLAIHGRTRSDFYNGEATFELIAKVKQSSKIPVFANGDIDTPEKALHILDYTKVDGLYIGRGALGKPWLFKQIKSFLATGYYDREINLEELILLMLAHLKMIHTHYGDELGVRIGRKHVKWYMQQNPKLYTNLNMQFSDFAALNNSYEQLKYLRVPIQV